MRSDIVQVHPFRRRNGFIEHLILRRSEADPLCPGAWQVVTGGAAIGEPAIDAAVRELREETGLIAKRWFVTGRVATFYFAPLDAIVHSPVIYCELADDAEPDLSVEHTDYRWCNAQSAIDALAFATHREAVSGIADVTSQSQ